jgi:hypothetical protein
MGSRQWAEARDENSESTALSLGERVARVRRFHQSVSRRTGRVRGLLQGEEGSDGPPRPHPSERTRQYLLFWAQRSAPVILSAAISTCHSVRSDQHLLFCAQRSAPVILCAAISTCHSERSEESPQLSSLPRVSSANYRDASLRACDFFEFKRKVALITKELSALKRPKVQKNHKLSA